jgi:hypothetical protein
MGSWRARLITLGRTQFLLVCAGLLVVGFAAWVVFSPALHLYDCEHRYLPSVEERFGFHAERIAVPGADHQLLGITIVRPGGLFDRAGFRVGDIPVDYHGGLARLCGALKYAEEGGEPEVAVVNVAAWGEQRTSRRLRLRAAW